MGRGWAARVAEVRKGCGCAGKRIRWQARKKDQAEENDEAEPEVADDGRGHESLRYR